MLTTSKTIPNAKIAALLPLLKGKARVLRDGAIQAEDNPNNRSVLEPFLTKEKKAAQGSTIFSPILPFRGKQKEAFEKMKDQAAFALMLEMGCGKTKLILDNAWYLFSKRKISGLLVIAPKGVQEQWLIHQIPTNIPEGVIGKTILFKNNATTKKLDLSPSGKLDVLAIHIDAIRTKDGKEMCERFLKAHNKKIMLVVDEAHRIKGYRSSVTKAAIALGEGVAYKRTMTGTPIAVSLIDEWSQFNFLDPQILKCKFVTLFRARYCVMGGYENKQIIGHQNVDRFNELVGPYCFRGTKESLGLPAKIFKPYHFDLSPEQLEAIREIKRTKGISLGSSLVELRNTVMKIQQVSNGFLIIKHEDGTQELKTFPNPRMEALKNVIEQNDGSIVIWARFTRDVEMIKKELGEEAVTYYGPDSDEERRRNLAQFLNGKKRFLISNDQTGGTGLELHHNHPTAIYYSNNTKPILRWQSEDRTHRIGITKPILYVDLIANKSADNGILKALNKHRSFSDSVLNAREKGRVEAFDEMEFLQSILKES